MKFLVFILIFLSFSINLAYSAPHKHGDGFKPGDLVEIQCQSLDSSSTTSEENSKSVVKWGPGPICRETGEPLSFHYGRDEFFHCSMEVSRDTRKSNSGSVISYSQFSSLLDQRSAWQCRVPFTPDKHVFIPFVIPLWGLAETNHLHAEIHYNFAFHADAGKILGASCYALRDYFQVLQVGSVFNFHGPVHWFSKHTFSPFSSDTSIKPPIKSISSGEYLTLGRASLSIILAFTFGAILMGSGLYFYYIKILKPKLIRRMLKNE